MTLYVNRMVCFVSSDKQNKPKDEAICNFNNQTWNLSLNNSLQWGRHDLDKLLITTNSILRLDHWPPILYFVLFICIVICQSKYYCSFLEWLRVSKHTMKALCSTPQNSQIEPCLKYLSFCCLIIFLNPQFNQKKSYKIEIV